MTLAFRDALPQDRAFVVSAWEASYRLCHNAGFILMQNWATVMREQITQVLDRPYTRTVVAYNPDDVDQLSGFIAAEPDETPPLILYCYVKEAHRKLGIARKLFRAIGIDPKSRFTYACETPIVAKFGRKIPLAKFTPINGRFSREMRRR